MKRMSCLLLLSCSLVFAGPVSASSPHKQVIVGAEDTVYGIAYHNGLPTHAVIKANNLKPPYVLTPGQVLIIPSPNEHIVGDGETLSSIADHYGLKDVTLAQANNIQPPYFVSPGERLSIPSHDTEIITEALKPPAVDNISTSSLDPLPLVNNGSQPPAASEPSRLAIPATAATLPDDLASELAREKGEGKAPPAPKKSSTKPPLMGELGKQATGQGVVGAGSSIDSSEVNEPQKKTKVTKKEEKPVKKQELSFAWPVKGKVVSKFNEGGKNDGIDIEVPEGTVVRASADGTVMYAGSELKGFGNLLLIKHKEGLVTAYAHNSSLLVGKGDKVKQGDKIAKSGVKGDSGASLLHFEIRKAKQPIDPLTKLKS